MWSDWLILVVEILFYFVFLYRYDEYGFSIVPALISVGSVVVYMIFFRERNAFFAVWAFVYGAVTCVGIAFWADAFSDFFEEIAPPFTGVAILLILGAFISEIYALSTLSESKYTYKEIERKEIVHIYSMSDESRKSGVFELGNGIINNQLVYIYHYKDSDGALVQDYASSDKNTSKIFDIIEDEEPHIEKSWTIKQTLNSETGEVTNEEIINGPLYYFYIPQGYVIEEYNFEQ